MDIDSLDQTYSELEKIIHHVTGAKPTVSVDEVRKSHIERMAGFDYDSTLETCTEMIDTLTKHPDFLLAEIYDDLIWETNVTGIRVLNRCYEYYVAYTDHEVFEGVGDSRKSYYRSLYKATFPNTAFWKHDPDLTDSDYQRAADYMKVGSICFTFGLDTTYLVKMDYYANVVQPFMDNIGLIDSALNPLLDAAQGLRKDFLGTRMRKKAKLHPFPAESLLTMARLIHENPDVSERLVTFVVERGSCTPEALEQCAAGPASLMHGNL